MLPDITLRLAICANDCPIGPRLERGVPLPPYRHTYALEDKAQAEADLELVRDYVQRNHLTNKKKK
jgi:hypothetical protein